MFGDSPNDLLNNLNEEHPLVVAVEYISKEESADVAAGSASAKHGVTGILAVQGAFAEHAAMLDHLGAPWKLLRAAEDFDDSIDRVILPGGGLFMWVDLPEGTDALEMFDFVFQKNIAYVPGQFFCCDGSGKNAMRLNFSTTGEEDIARCIPILGEMIKQYMKK